MSYAPFTAIGFRLSVYIAKVIGYSQSLGLLNAKKAFEVLEPRAGKLASSVLRGRSGSNATLLPDYLVRFLTYNIWCTKEKGRAKNLAF